MTISSYPTPKYHSRNSLMTHLSRNKHEIEFLEMGFSLDKLTYYRAIKFIFVSCLFQPFLIYDSIKFSFARSLPFFFHSSIFDIFGVIYVFGSLPCSFFKKKNTCIANTPSLHVLTFQTFNSFFLLITVFNFNEIQLINSLCLAQFAPLETFLDYSTPFVKTIILFRLTSHSVA